MNGAGKKILVFQFEWLKSIKISLGNTEISMLLIFNDYSWLYREPYEIYSTSFLN